MKKISVDWSLAESKPEKGQKVEGRFLLDLRSKINDMEQQLKVKNGKITTATSELEGIKERLKETEDKLKENIEENELLRKDKGDLQGKNKGD